MQRKCCQNYCKQPAAAHREVSVSVELLLSVAAGRGASPVPTPACPAWLSPFRSLAVPPPASAWGGTERAGPGCKGGSGRAENLQVSYRQC